MEMVKLIDKVLSAPPPPVVAKEVYDAAVAQIEMAVDILDGQEEPINWADQSQPELLRKLSEAFGAQSKAKMRAHYQQVVAMLNQRLAERTQDTLARIVEIEGDLRKKVAAAEKDAEDLAEALERIVRGCKEDAEHWRDYPQFRESVIGGIVGNQAIAEAALAAHEALKPSTSQKV